MPNSFNTVIIGSGVAGMTAAIYLKRANIDFTIIEKSAPGGQINRASIIENYPGFENIDGPSLAFNIYNQITKLGIDIKFGEVTKIDVLENEKHVYLGSEKIICKNIILALGRIPKELGLKNEKDLVGNGVSWCALCDGHFYKDKDVAVIGAGDSAFEEAIYLSNICKKVYIISRSDKFKAKEHLVNRVQKINNIIIKKRANVIKLNVENDHLLSVDLDIAEQLEVKGLFIYIGSSPDTSFLKNLKLKKKQGYLVTNKSMETNIKGIYACGDVVYKNAYQLTTAVGEATIAASSIIHSE